MIVTILNSRSSEAFLDAVEVTIQFVGVSRLALHSHVIRQGGVRIEPVGVTARVTL